MSRLFLGLDSSTQSLSAILIDVDAPVVVYEHVVNFDEALPHYGTQNGALRADDAARIHSPPGMWVEALDLLFARMRDDGVALCDVLAVSGSGQQHGSVYLNASAPAVLAALDPERPLLEGMETMFSRPTAPIWMDSSTSRQCEAIEAALGGRQATAEATGSAAFERFTGPQIRKFFEDDPAAYEDTAHIALVSSFLASVLAGRIAPIDHGDGAGMNLMDIRTKQWLPAALDATAPGLAARLPPLAPSWSKVGTIHPTFGRFGFRDSTRCIAWSGDNPNSVIGLGLIEPGMIAISLGTSDTFFGVMKECRTDPNAEGHVFGSPTGDYMTIICYMNGSLARERVKDQHGLDWDGFSRCLRETPPGNHGKIMIPWFAPEIVPRVLAPRVHRFGLSEEDVAGNCRAVIEAQMMSMRIHSAWMDVRPSSIYATGGASANRDILQVMADVHQCPVYRQETTNSAALGAALRAAHAYFVDIGEPDDWHAVTAGFTDRPETPIATPDPAAADVYTDLCAAYAESERTARG